MASLVCWVVLYPPSWASTQDSLAFGEQQGVGLGGAVCVAGQGQGPVVIGQGQAHGGDGVKVSNLVGRSKVMFPGQVGALTRLVAPPRVAISARSPSMADWRDSCRAVSSAPVA